MNELYADVGWLSVNHAGEELCGDHVAVLEREQDGSTVVVLADGLGSGVKASILSTLTSKIISTMLYEGLSLQDCVETVAAALPICSVRGVAYSTFTIIRILQNSVAELIQYDNPQIIMYRDGQNYEYDRTETVIGGKKILQSRIRLQEGDTFLAMSDGCPHAGVGVAYNFGWKREDIMEYMEPLTLAGYTAKTLATVLVEEVNRLYDSQPGDDATACVVRMARRAPMNLLFGPPANRDDANKMMALFFSKEGKHIICGGTTSSIAAKYLGRPLSPSVDFPDPKIPPIAYLEGVDLVTEGVVTIARVVDYAKDYLGENTSYAHWSMSRDGASQICRLLFEEATDINFYVGRAVNPAHQNPNLPINFNIKMQLVEELSQSLRQMGKRVKISYF